MKEKCRKQQKKNTQRQKGERGTEDIVKDIAKWFCCAFKLGFLQLIYQASLIFQSNLELALSII